MMLQLVGNKGRNRRFGGYQKSSESKESAEESDKATGLLIRLKQKIQPLKKAERVEKQATGKSHRQAPIKRTKVEVVAQDDADVKVRAAGKKSQGGKQDQDAASGEPGRQNQAASKVRMAQPDNKVNREQAGSSPGIKRRRSTIWPGACFLWKIRFDKDKADDSRRDGNRSVGKNKP